jgi:hypothetical protein
VSDSGAAPRDIGTRELWEELRAVRDHLRLLSDAILLDVPPPEIAKAGKRVGVLRKRADATTALRARVGRAARRNGFTYRKWVEEFGMRDRDV